MTNPDFNGRPGRLTKFVSGSESLQVALKGANFVKQ